MDATLNHNGSVVPALLREYGDVTRVALVRYLRQRPPERHLYDLVADYPRRGGRMLRPSLCIATARAFGGDVEETVRVAAAIELLHNAFLVHDDIEDDSESRRGRPTLHRLHGTPVAVNVGDALALLGLDALLANRWRIGSRLTLRLLEDAERMMRESIEGQAVELGWRRDNALHVTDADYLEMVLKKTCWYTTIFPLRAGMLIGTHSAFGLDHIVRFGFFLGAAFQIQDDVLNLAGDESSYGKELNGDLWEGKRTLILLHALRQLEDAERSRLAAFLAKERDERTAAEVHWVRGRIDECSSVEYAKTVAHGLAGAARHEWARCSAQLRPSRDRAFLEALSLWVLRRN